MTDPGGGIAEEWLEALAESLDVFERFVQDPQVMDAWTTASTLDGYTVGGNKGTFVYFVHW